MEVAKEQARTRQIIADLIVIHLQKKKNILRKITTFQQFCIPKIAFICCVHLEGGFFNIINKIVF